MHTMGDEIDRTHATTSLKDLQERSPHGENLRQIMDFYVPLALDLPSLRDDPAFMKEQVKATATSGVTDVATAADIYMQERIKAKVAAMGNDWQFWGEEGEDSGVIDLDPTKTHTFITDPIEGTNNFKRRIEDQWGSVVSLVDNKTGEPVIGIIAHPSNRRFYVGIKDGGAYIINYDESGQVSSFVAMTSAPEKPEFTYNSSPHFSDELVERVGRFHTLGTVMNTDELGRSTVEIGGNTFVDPESGALEVIRNRGTIYFKSSAEMAAVFTILNEMGGKVTDGKGKPWSLGINSLIAARTPEDHTYLKGLYEQTAKTV